MPIDLAAKVSERIQVLFSELAGVQDDEKFTKSMNSLRGYLAPTQLELIQSFYDHGHVLETALESISSELWDGDEFKGMPLVKAWENSSNVAATGFNPDLNRLTVEFLNGSRYVYFDFTAAHWEQLEKAHSIGKFFQQSVKGSFDYVRDV